MALASLGLPVNVRMTSNFPFSSLTFQVLDLKEGPTLLGFKWTFQASTAKKTVETQGEKRFFFQNFTSFRK